MDASDGEGLSRFDRAALRRHPRQSGRRLVANRPRGPGPGTVSRPSSGCRTAAELHSWTAFMLVALVAAPAWAQSSEGLGIQPPQVPGSNEIEAKQLTKVP